MREEMAIVEELHVINRKLTAGIQVDTYGEMQVINRAANAITCLTNENAALIASADRLMNMRIELEKERNAMREQLDAIDKYLDIGTSDTSIHQNSVMHREVKALLGDEIKLKPSEDEAMNSALKASSTLVAKGRLDKGRED